MLSSPGDVHLRNFTWLGDGYSSPRAKQKQMLKYVCLQLGAVNMTEEC